MNTTSGTEGKGRRSAGLAGRVTWAIDPVRSRLLFALRHIIVHQIRGSFARWGGTIALDERDPARSRVDVWIDLASVDTGDPARDDHVRSAEFFDVARFPQATFASVEIRTSEGPVAVVRGRLDLHGVGEDLDVEIVDQARSTDPDGRERCTFTVKTRFDRRRFGLRWNQDLDVGGVVVGDIIEIEAHVEAVRLPERRES